MCSWMAVRGLRPPQQQRSGRPCFRQASRRVLQSTRPDAQNLTPTDTLPPTDSWSELPR